MKRVIRHCLRQSSRRERRSHRRDRVEAVKGEGDARESGRISERADWMEPADDHLLALLRDERKDTFNTIAEQLPLAREEVAARCRTLAAHGLVEHLGSDIYTISPLGKRYLDGEVGAPDLDDGEDDH